MHPGDLQTLAVHAFGKFVYRLYLKLVQSSTEAEVILIRQHLKEMLVSAVPAFIADEFTSKLIKCLDTEHKSMYMLPHEKEILQQLIIAIIHPDVTRLDLIQSDAFHRNNEEVKFKLLFPFVYNTLHDLKRLKSLSIGDTFSYIPWSPDPVCLSETLVEFTFVYGCSSRVVTALADSCKGLKKLDISESIGVDDSCVPALNSFRHLESLKLAGTFISSEHITKLLKRLSKTKVSGEGEITLLASQILRSFGCHVKPLDAQILVNGFQNLVEIDLEGIPTFDISFLTQLKQLTVVRLRYFDFTHIMNFLSARGNMLRCLDLYYVHRVDLIFIAQMCTSLTCLHLEPDKTYGLSYSYNTSNLSMPKFSTVECLRVILHSETDATFVFSQFASLRKLDIVMSFCDQFSWLMDTLEIYPQRHLEEITFHWEIELSDMRKVVERCPSLRVVKVLSPRQVIWRGDQLEKWSVETTYLVPGGSV